MPPARTPPAREHAYVVFGQGRDARVDVDAWNAHAVRFFSTRIGLGSTDPAETVFVVAPDGAAPGRRAAFARPTDAQDLALADAAEARAGGGGLALLARRCGMVWLVEREGDHDPLALRLAAILASVLLGPILDVTVCEIFGVKTARSKLEGHPQTTRS